MGEFLRLGESLPGFPQREQRLPLFGDVMRGADEAHGLAIGVREGPRPAVDPSHTAVRVPHPVLPIEFPHATAKQLEESMPARMVLGKGESREDLREGGGSLARIDSVDAVLLA